MRTLHLWEVDDGEQHWYSAGSREEAIELYCEPFCNPKTGKLQEEDLPCERDELEVSQISPGTILPVKTEDDVLVKKTAQEWADEGVGLVASTVY